MSKLLNTINNSDALTNGRSQLLGTVKDDSIVMEFEKINIINTDGPATPYAVIIQKVDKDVKEVLESGQTEFVKLHLPPQIKTIGLNAFTAAVYCKEINLENVEQVLNVALAGLAAQNETPVVIHLDKAIIVASEAFADANAEIYLNENVETVEEGAFAGAAILHYKGQLEGAPWGAKEWIKD